jgi:hypothetical protein
MIVDNKQTMEARYGSLEIMSISESPDKKICSVVLRDPHFHCLLFQCVTFMSGREKIRYPSRVWELAQRDYREEVATWNLTVCLS